MSNCIHSIGRAQTLATAQKRMHEFHVRHLPVLDGGRLLGIVSERDLAMVATFPGVDPETMSVDEAMTDDPYAVRPDTELAEVARTMAEKRIGAAVVMEDGQVLGIFTTVDACRVLAERLT